MRLNVHQAFSEVTHEGARAAHMTPLQALRRSVCSCLLWESEFYEDGQAIAARIEKLASEVSAEALAELAVEVRSKMNLRHVPLLLLKALIQRQGKGKLIRDAIAATIQRPDELGELLAVAYGNPAKLRKLSNPLREGLALAFGKFSEYSLAKYDRDAGVKLRDVMRLVHPKPKDDAQAAMWGRLIKRELTTPDTWEVELSAGKDKKATFERLIIEGKLGYLALLRNLRNMVQADVDQALVRDAILARKGGAERVLPFRFVAAARAAPLYEAALDASLCVNIRAMPVLKGKTIVLVDVSGSMSARLSASSDMTRMDAACALASVINAESLRVFSFSNSLVEVPARRGMAGVDAVQNSQLYGRTHLGQAVASLALLPRDRLIVITDEQSHDDVGNLGVGRRYMINVASYKNGVGYGGWTHIDGFSEGVIRFIYELESLG